MRRHPEVDPEERLEQEPGRSRRRSGWRPVRAPACAAVVIHRTLAYPIAGSPVTVASTLSPGLDRTRTLRGAVCGAVAAGRLGAAAAAGQAAPSPAATTTSSCSARRSPAATAGTRSASRCTCGNGAAVRRRVRQPGAGDADPAPAARAGRRRWPSTSPCGRWARVTTVCIRRARSSRSCSGNRAGVPPGGLAPPALRPGAGRARAPRQRRARAGSARARDRLLEQRPRLARARRVGPAGP